MNTFKNSKLILILSVIALFGASCSSTSETSTSPSNVPETLGLSVTEETGTSNPVSPGSTLIAADDISTSADTSSTTVATQTNKSSTTQVSVGLPTCSTNEYQVTIPVGWNTANSGDLACAAFIKDAFPASLECDCSLSVLISTHQEDAATKIAALQSSAAGAVTVSPVLNSTAQLLVGDWELNEVQAGGTGVNSGEYIYVFEDGSSSILVTATEFHDFGGTYSYADRKAAADELAASLVIL